VLPGGSTIWIRNHVDASIHLSAYGRHPGDQRSYWPDDRERHSCQHSTALSKCNLTVHRVSSRNCEHNQYRRRPGSDGRCLAFADWWLDSSLRFAVRHILRSSGGSDPVFSVRVFPKMADLRLIRLFRHCHGGKCTLARSSARLFHSNIVKQCCLLDRRRRNIWHDNQSISFFLAGVSRGGRNQKREGEKAARKIAGTRSGCYTTH